MNAPTFRQNFPEFVDPETYPDPTIAFWQGIGTSLLPADRWGSSLDYGLQLFVAHHLVIGQREQVAADAGGAPGQIKGPVSSKSVDKVSVSYDTSAVSLTDAGFWGMTSYGLRFYQLVRMFGAGGIQI